MKESTDLKTYSITVDPSKIQSFAFKTIGITVSFVAFGILEERITRHSYGEANVKFVFYQTLVGLLCLSYYLIAQTGHIVLKEKKDESSKIFYVFASLSYLISSLLSNMALQWVPYPVQVVAKAAKPIPTLLLTTLIARKKYTWRKYVVVLIIVAGITLFMYRQDCGADAMQNAWYGEILLCASLILDGFCGGFEERIRKDSSPSPFSMMLAMNGISAAILLTIAVVSGEFIQFINFVNDHPVVIQHIALLALAGGLGQTFIFYMVIEFGVLPCSIVTTARKFFTILFSISFFENSLQMHQWYGAVLVFGGLFSDILFTNESACSIGESESQSLEKAPLHDSEFHEVEKVATQVQQSRKRSFVEIDL